MGEIDEKLGEIKETYEKLDKMGEIDEKLGEKTHISPPTQIWFPG